MLDIRVWHSFWGIRFGIQVWDSGLGFKFWIRLRTKDRDSYMGFLFEIQV